MDALQNFTSAPTQTPPATQPDNTPPSEALLSVQQLAWIDYNALNGLITDNMDVTDEKKSGLRKMPITEFAALVGVSRPTLYHWRVSIPNFWSRVQTRRSEMAPMARLSKVHEVWYLKAVKGEWQHLDAWLRNFDPNYKPANMKVEHDVSENLADVMEIARQRRQQQENKPQIIEGEVVNDQTIQTQPNGNN